VEYMPSGLRGMGGAVFICATRAGASIQKLNARALIEEDIRYTSWRSCGLCRSTTTRTFEQAVPGVDQRLDDAEIETKLGKRWIPHEPERSSLPSRADPCVCGPSLVALILARLMIWLTERL
jgi:hypothetical protein